MLKLTWNAIEQNGLAIQENKLAIEQNILAIERNRQEIKSLYTVVEGL